jgi:hypothetical protein
MFIASRMMLAKAGASKEQNFFQDLVDDGLDTNCVLCLDAGSATSYDGSSQNFVDLTANGNDFYLGSSGTPTTDDPTFNGTSGNLSSSEYFQTDGGDVMDLQGANPTWVDNMHKNGATWTALFWVYIVNPPGSTNYSLWGTSGGTNGIRVVLNDADKYQFLVDTGHLNTSSPSVAAGYAGWNLVGWSIDENGGAAASFFYRNGVETTFNSAFSSPSAAAATAKLELFGHGNSASTLCYTGTRIASAQFFDTNLTAANVDTIWATQKGRFGL